MRCFLLIVTVNAAVFSAKQDDDALDRFAMEVSNHRNMSPFEQWLLPEWMAYMQCFLEPKGEVPISAEGDFLSNLKFLDDLQLPGKSRAVSEAIREHLKAQSWRIRKAYEFACEHLEGEQKESWQKGLKDYAAHLARNAQGFPQKSVDNNPMVRAFYAFISGLIGGLRDFAFIRQNNDEYCLYAISQIMDPTQEISADQDPFYWPFAMAMLLSSGPEDEDLIDSLFTMHFSVFHIDRQPFILKKIGEIPIGHRITVSISDPPSILELMKAEDEHIYGVKYTMTGCSAFQIPLGDLKEILFDQAAFESPEISRKVQLPWYGDLPKKNGLDMIISFTRYWGEDSLERLRIGAIWFICKLLCDKRRSKRNTVPIPNVQNFYGLSPQSARLLLPKLKKLPTPKRQREDEIFANYLKMISTLSLGK